MTNAPASRVFPSSVPTLRAYPRPLLAFHRPVAATVADPRGLCEVEEEVEVDQGGRYAAAAAGYGGGSGPAFTPPTRLGGRCRRLLHRICAAEELLWGAQASMAGSAAKATGREAREERAGGGGGERRRRRRGARWRGARRILGPPGSVEVGGGDAVREARDGDSDGKALRGRRSCGTERAKQSARGSGEAGPREKHQFGDLPVATLPNPSWQRGAWLGAGPGHPNTGSAYSGRAPWLFGLPNTPIDA
ncbi:hypothetical protein U9M48_020573 [Paspalum notatum var. saurae]|uniref:Uncharacterized protein n=1 Tax=Paspalum notatum var. saurae TaxID=547442 RepID=A0AAQ3WSF1_PASNO